MNEVRDTRLVRTMQQKPHSHISRAYRADIPMPIHVDYAHVAGYVTHEVMTRAIHRVSYGACTVMRTASAQTRLN